VKSVKAADGAGLAAEAPPTATSTGRATQSAARSFLMTRLSE